MNRSPALCALLLAVLALPTTASAATRCVPAPTAGCDSSHATITAAVAAAVDGDTVAIAAGTYTESITTGKRLSFLGAGGGTLESAGGTTTIAPVSGSALTLTGGGSLRAIRALGSSGFIGNTGIVLQPAVAGNYSYSLTDVVGIGGLATDMTFGFGGYGLSAGSSDASRVVSLAISNSQFRAGDGTGFTIISGVGLSLNGAGTTSTISRSRIVGPAAGSGQALVATGTKATIEDSTVTGGVAGQLSDGDYTVRRSRFLGTPASGGYGRGLVGADLINGLPLKLTVEDSLIVGEPGTDVIDAHALSVGVYGGADAPVVDVNGSTLIERGSADPDAAVAIVPSGASPPAATVNLRNSVARLEGTAESGEADLVALHGTITAASSAFSSAATAGSGTTTAPGSGSNLPGDPQLDAGFAPAAGSRLIDRGDPAFAYSGELDITANARSQDGNGDCVARPDIGAFELAGRCPKVAAPDVAPAISRASLSRKRFTTRKPVHKGRKRGATLRFTLSEAATVAVTIERKAKGRRVRLNGKRRCVKPTKRNAGKARCTRYLKARTLRLAGKVGANELKLGGRRLGPGAYRLTLAATDPAGHRSKPVRLGFTVLRP